MSIADDFNRIARVYDKQRRNIIPCFDDFYSLPIEVIDYSGESPKVLDMGSGTGTFSLFLLSKYPKAKITMIDLAEEMMKQAQTSFAAYSDINYILADYTQYDFPEKFDIIISALSIHHLSHDDKKKLFKKCFGLLNDGGCFINADWVLSPSDYIESVNFNAFQEHHIKSGLSEKEREAVYERMKHDAPATLTDQLRWLQEAEFKHIDCIFKRHHLCVLYGQK